MASDARHPGWTGRLAVVALALLWGLNWPAVRVALTEIPPWTLRTAGLALAAAALFALAAVRGRSLRVPEGRRLALAFAGLLNIAGFNVMTAFAQLHTATSRAAIVTFTMPLFATAFAFLVLREVPDRVQRIGLGLGTLGLGVLLYPLAGGLGIPLGVAFSLGAALSWAAGTVFLKRARIQAEPLAIAAWQLVAGASAAGLGMLAFEGLVQPFPLSGPVIVALAYHVVLAQALAYFLWFEVVARLPAGTAALGTLGIPVVGVLGAMLLLGERPTVPDLIGFALILAAAATVLLPRRR
ncbi:MAG TPA: DMT family transporter [Geminicoccaceae bacterium]